MDAADRNDSARFYWSTAPSPLGKLLLVLGPGGLYQVAFAGEDFQAVLAAVEEDRGAEPQHDPGALADVTAQLEEYFAGERTSFDVELDLTGVPEFSRRVLTELQQVPYGETVSYAELAEISANPRAARAVGSACARNRLPIFIPCHRVVRSDQAAGGYRGGAPAKAFLRQLELGNG